MGLGRGGLGSGGGRLVRLLLRLGVWVLVGGIKEMGMRWGGGVPGFIMVVGLFEEGSVG